MSDQLFAFVRELQTNSDLHNFFVSNPTETLHEYDLSGFDAQHVLSLVNGAPALGLDLGHLSVADGSGGLVSGLGAAATVGSHTVSAVLPDHTLAFGQGDILSTVTGAAGSSIVPGGLLEGTQVSTIEHSLSSVTSVGNVLGGASPFDATGFLSSVTTHHVTQETTQESHHGHGTHSTHTETVDHTADLHHGVLDNGLLDNGLLHLAL